MLELTGSKLWLIHFYKEQLAKFEKLGMGKKTEFGVLITDKLIKVTKNRLDKISVVYDKSLSPQAHKLRRLKLQKFRKEHHNN